jgi:hypothetical protein
MPADDSFFSRWSRRKVAVRQGEALPPEPVPEPPAAAAPPSPVAAVVAAPATEPAPTATPEPAAPTLADVQQLTPESDFTAFVRPQVQPEVRNAALKKLFADPHFNVMDGLDTYIDDYNTPDPLPEGMLQQLVQSEMLGLFAPAPAPAPEPGPEAHPAGPAEATASAERAERAATPATAPNPEPTPDVDRHENADLQLQPDDAAGRPGPDPGAAAHAGRPH